MDPLLIAVIGGIAITLFFILTLPLVYAHVRSALNNKKPVSLIILYGTEGQWRRVQTIPLSDDQDHIIISVTPNVMATAESRNRLVEHLDIILRNHSPIVLDRTRRNEIIQRIMEPDETELV